jgi:hypothetical protein
MDFSLGDSPSHTKGGCCAILFLPLTLLCSVLWFVILQLVFVSSSVPGGFTEPHKGWVLRDPFSATDLLCSVLWFVILQLSS